MEFEENKYTYDTFEDCPACDEWRMRVRVRVFEWISSNGIYLKKPGSLNGFMVFERISSSGIMRIADRYFFDLRCLNCGYSNRFFEVDPISFEEEELEGILRRERRRLQETGEAKLKSKRSTPKT